MWESKLIGKGIIDSHRLQYSLRVVMDSASLFGLLRCDLLVDRVADPLPRLDSRRLLTVFVDADDEATVHQLRIDVAGGGGHERRDRSLDVVAFHGGSSRTGFLTRDVVLKIVQRDGDKATDGLVTGRLENAGDLQMGAQVSSGFASVGGQLFAKRSIREADAEGFAWIEERLTL